MWIDVETNYESEYEQYVRVKVADLHVQTNYEEPGTDQRR